MLSTGVFTSNAAFEPNQILALALIKLLMLHSLFSKVSVKLKKMEQPIFFLNNNRLLTIEKI